MGFGRRAILTKSSVFLEYIKIHLISLEQDKELIEKTSLKDDSIDWHFINGQIQATEHLLSVATDIMNSTNERYNNDNI
jgi:hypothetical protein